MAFVEAMVIEVCRGDDPGPADRGDAVPAASPTTRRWSGSAATSRTCGSGWSSSTSAPLWRARRPSGLPRVRRRARGRRPGQGDRRAGHGRRHRRKEIDELTERAKRFGAKGLVWLAVEETARVRVADREVPRRRRRGAARRPRRREPGRPRPHRRRRAGRHRRRPRPAAGRARRRGSGWPIRTCSSFCWVHRFPMYQWDAENEPLGRDPQPVQRRRPRGRGAARRRPPATRRSPSPGRSGRPGPGAPVRHRAQRLGARRRLDPDPPPRPARPELRAPGPDRGRDAGEVRGGARGVRVRRRRRTAGSPSASIAGRRSSPTSRTSARSWPSRRRSRAPT